MSSAPAPKAPRSPRRLKLTRSLVLVGMMGVGKTSIGRRLAPRLGLPFFDADEEIEKAAGMAVADLFASHGEESFRAGEAQVIERLLSGPPILLATGGGAMMNEDTRALVKENALSVWLQADVDTIVKRATSRPTRPLLQAGNPKEIIAKLLEERSPQYASADIHIKSQNAPHAKTVNAIVKAIAEYLKPETPS